jgi:hypothetical protein
MAAQRRCRRVATIHPHTLRHRRLTFWLLFCSIENLDAFLLFATDQIYFDIRFARNAPVAHKAQAISTG